MVQVLGTDKFDTIEQLFPSDPENPVKQGLNLQFPIRFSIANKSIDEQIEEDQKRIAFYGSVAAHPIFGQDIGNAYRATMAQSEAMGITDFEDIIHKPSEAGIKSPDQVIVGLMNGEEVMPNPKMNFVNYITEIEIFMRTGKSWKGYRVSC